jgi:hypothetical protein
MDDLIDRVYPNLTTVHMLPEKERQAYFSERAILAPLNVHVDDINDACIDKLMGDTTTYLSVDSALDDNDNTDHGSYPKEFLNTINVSGMPVHSMTLKIGCPIMLLRNLDPSAGLCNGTRLIITALKSRVIEARILTGTHAGTPAFIPRLTLIMDSSSALPFKLRRSQFPIRIAFGMSINKSQGQSLWVVGVLLSVPVFAHGQLYVALSRAIDCDHIYVSLPSTSERTSTVNIVYLEMLRRNRVNV